MSNRRNTFFTSDLHFGHANVIRFCNRPFKDIEEMELHFIKTWNKQVKPHDTVYCLGDMFWSTLHKTKIKSILSQLNGEKHLVIGNHDKLSITQAQNLGFHSANYETKIRIGKIYVRLSHYPYRYTLIEHIKANWKSPKRLFNRKWMRLYDRLPHNNKEYLIHGHTHSPNKFNKKQIHIGVDAWDYKLVSIDDIVKYINKLEQK